MALIHLTCKQVAALLVAREDRQLPLSDRLRVQMHLLACKTCPDFERQLLTLRQAMKQWRNDTDDTPPRPDYRQGL
jgi:hypothetical protein